MNDNDIYAFTPAPAALPTRAARKRRVWLWVLMGTALLLALLMVAGVAALHALVQSSTDGLDVSVNGHPWGSLHSDPDLGFFGVLGLVAALLSLLVVLPVVLVLVLLAVVVSVGLALLAIVGAVVLAACCVLLVVMLVLSPLWGGLLVLWLLLRPRRNMAAAHVAP